MSSLGNSTAQKFGYNGKELNEELGIQWHDFGARNYDAALGRWMNLDPLAEQYTNVTPYAFVANMPTMAVDPDGKRIIIVGNSKYRRAILSALTAMASTKEGFKMLEGLVNSEDNVVIGHFQNGKKTKSNRYRGRTKNKKSGKTSYWVNINLNDKEAYSDNTPKTLEGSITHELGHVDDVMNGNGDDRLATTKEGANSSLAVPSEEVNNIHRTNIIRAGLGQKLRTKYAGVQVMNMEVTRGLVTFDDNNGFSTTAFEIKPKAKNMYFDYTNVNKASAKSLANSILYMLSRSRTTNNISQFSKSRNKISKDVKSATIIE